MKTTVLSVLICCCVALTGWCQPNIVTFCVIDGQEFTCPCAGGPSLPDGSAIVVFRDLNGSGPDPADTAVAGGVWSPGTGGCAFGFEVASGTFYGMIFTIECCWHTAPFVYVAQPGPQEVEMANWSCSPLGCDELLAVRGPREVEPRSWELLRAYPNPFNPTTTIEFFVSQTGLIGLTVFDVQGRLVETLAQETMLSGPHAIHWNAAGFPSGIYWAQLTSGREVHVQKLLLMK